MKTGEACSNKDLSAVGGLLETTGSLFKCFKSLFSVLVQLLFCYKGQ